MNKKTAFTLAEVLVTLMIIGVIASMTIPALKRTSDEQAFVAGALKAYSTIANVTKILRLENGPPRMWNLSAANVTDMYRKKMNAMDNSAGAYDTLYLNGNKYENANMFDKTLSFYTADGMLYYIQSTSGSCSATDSTSFANGCIDWGVDVNGPKGPNKVGIDIFGIYVTNTDVYPAGGGPGTSLATCVTGGTGWACAARVLKEGKITW